MPTYNVYFFVVKPPQPPHMGGSGETAALGGGAEPSAMYTQFLTDFRALLSGYFEQSAASIPYPESVHRPDWQVQVQEIPSLRPGVPDFSGLTIQAHEPIVYLVSRQHAPTPEFRRRATYAMVDAFEQGRFAGTPSEAFGEWRDAMRNPSEVRGVSLIGSLDASYTESFRFAPLVAEVFTDLSLISTPRIFGQLRISQLAHDWVNIMSNFVAKASFHEVAHCKSECHNQPAASTDPPWSATRSHSIHDESGAGILGTEVAWTTEPTASDFTLMGRHMLCPVPFYKLDQPLGGQFTNHGQAHTLAVQPPPEEEASDSDDLDMDLDTDDPLGGAL